MPTLNISKESIEKASKAREAALRKYPDLRDFENVLKDNRSKNIQKKGTQKKGE